MTTFQIPEGKVVDSIEFKSEEKAAVLNIRYKEDRPEEKKRVIVLCETNQPTTLYYHTKYKRLVEVFYRVKEEHTHLYIPVANENADEFVVIQEEVYKESLQELSELCAILRSIENGNVTTEETFRQIDILSRRARALQVFLATQGQ